MIFDFFLPIESSPCLFHGCEIIFQHLTIGKENIKLTGPTFLRKPHNGRKCENCKENTCKFATTMTTSCVIKLYKILWRGESPNRNRAVLVEPNHRRRSMNIFASACPDERATQKLQSRDFQMCAHTNC